MWTDMVKVQCVIVKLLKIFHNKINKKCAKAITFQNECCSITKQESSDV